MSDVPQGPGWWQAADGKWYQPQYRPSAEPLSVPEPAPPKPIWQQHSGLTAAAALVVALAIAGLIGAVAKSANPTKVADKPAKAPATVTRPPATAKPAAAPTTKVLVTTANTAR